MLSETYNISEFLDKTKDKNYRRVLILADREATAVERCLCRRECTPPADPRMREYAITLKDFIDFMRFGIKTRKVSRLDLDHFDDLRQSR
ncbi:MAG: hypothetical protein P8X55_18015 [Desulfosarcinaceae bacterium]